MHRNKLEQALRKDGLTANGTSRLSGERHVNTGWHIKIKLPALAGKI